jgi:hypothetical protein
LKEDVPSGFVDIDVDEEHRLFRTVVDHTIGRLWCSDRVVVDLLVAEDIIERLAGSRCGIAVLSYRITSQGAALAAPARPRC